MRENLGMGGWEEAPRPAVAATNGNGAHPHVAKAPPPLTDAQRELFLQDLLCAFERGDLDAYEYTHKVHALERAASLAQAAAALEDQSPVPAAPVPGRRSLDPVDMVLMSAAPKRSDRSRSTNRYLMLVVVTIVFIVLLVAGIWLDLRVRSTASSTGNGASAAAQVAGSPVPVSPLSPRR